MFAGWKVASRGKKEEKKVLPWGCLRERKSGDRLKGWDWWWRRCGDHARLGWRQQDTHTHTHRVNLCLGWRSLFWSEEQRERLHRRRRCIIFNINCVFAIKIRPLPKMYKPELWTTTSSLLLPRSVAEQNQQFTTPADHCFPFFKTWFAGCKPDEEMQACTTALPRHLFCCKNKPKITFHIRCCRLSPGGDEDSASSSLKPLMFPLSATINQHSSINFFVFGCPPRLLYFLLALFQMDVWDKCRIFFFVCIHKHNQRTVQQGFTAAERPQRQLWIDEFRICD